MIGGVDHERLVKFVARIVGEQDAEDVIQTTYLKVLASPSFRSESSFLSWVYAIAKRAAYDALRHRQRRPSDYGTEPVDDLQDANDVAQRLEDRDEAEHLLDGVPARWAQAIRAFAAEGTYENAAESLGLPVNVLKGRIRRGREAIGSRSSNKTFFIYGLLDLSHKVRYVGCTSQPLSQRLRKHRSEARLGRGPNGWLSQGGSVVLLASANTENEAAELERDQIKRFAGTLTNIALGGPGRPGTFDSEETLRRKRSAQRGEKNGNAALTSEAVDSIRSERLRGVSIHELASLFGVSESSISMIANGKRWGNV